jgi:hypothetical protein
LPATIANAVVAEAAKVADAWAWFVAHDARLLVPRVNIVGRVLAKKWMV